MLGFCLSSTPQLPGNSQLCPSPLLPGNSLVGLVHYKRGCLPLPLPYSLSLSFSLAQSWAPLPSSPLPPLSTWSWPPLLLYSLLLSAFLCLSYPLSPPPHDLNRLSSILKTGAVSEQVSGIAKATQTTQENPVTEMGEKEARKKLLG